MKVEKKIKYVYTFQHDFIYCISLLFYLHLAIFYGNTLLEKVFSCVIPCNIYLPISLYILTAAPNKSQHSLFCTQKKKSRKGVQKTAPPNARILWFICAEPSHFSFTKNIFSQFRTKNSFFPYTRSFYHKRSGVWIHEYFVFLIIFDM